MLWALLSFPATIAGPGYSRRVPGRPLLSRRSALGLAAVGVAVTACDVDDLRPPEDDAAPSPTPAEPDAPTADETAVETVLAALTSATGVLVAARRVPELRQPLGGLLRAHRAHVGALDGTQAFGTTLPTPTDAATALQQVRVSERDLRTTLVGAASAAESGALARLLASAAASVSQHLAVLG